MDLSEAAIIDEAGQSFSTLVYHPLAEMMSKTNYRYITHPQLSYYHETHEENLNLKRIILRHNLG